MTTTLGIVTLIAGLIAWIGQSLAFFTPSTAVNLGVLEPEEELDPTLYVIEVRAMGLSDMLLAWTLPVSALLMLLGHPLWPYLALFGSGVFMYFSAVTMLSRAHLKRSGKKVGRPRIGAGCLRRRHGLDRVLAGHDRRSCCRALVLTATPMTGLDELSAASELILFVMVSLIAMLTFVVAWAQVGCIRGRPFENPDGTRDDWREQKIFYGMAWADVVVACPLSIAGVGLTMTAPKLGLFLLAGVSVWLMWANVMTTVTSLRFEHPRLTLRWFVVFPFGAIVGLAYLVWVLVHFEAVYG